MFRKLWRRIKPPPKPPKTEIDQKLQELYTYFKFNNIIEDLNEEAVEDTIIEDKIEDAIVIDEVEDTIVEDKPTQTYDEIIKGNTTHKSVELQHEATDFRTKKAEEYREKYHNYLKSDEWQEKRLTVLKKAAFICRDCRKNKATEVHHETYKRVFNERINDLTALCYKCHRKRHHK